MEYKGLHKNYNVPCSTIQHLQSMISAPSCLFRRKLLCRYQLNVLIISEDIIPMHLVGLVPVSALSRSSTNSKHYQSTPHQHAVQIPAPLSIGKGYTHVKSLLSLVSNESAPDTVSNVVCCQLDIFAQRGGVAVFYERGAYYKLL